MKTELSGQTVDPAENCLSKEETGAWECDNKMQRSHTGEDDYERYDSIETAALGNSEEADQSQNSPGQHDAGDEEEAESEDRGKVLK